MSSFSCPHLDLANNRCLRLSADCVPGRRGCVLGSKSGFAFPLEERLANRTTAAASGPGFAQRKHTAVIKRAAL